MVIDLPEEKQTREVPIEDIGLLIMDHPQITITQPVLSKLLQNNTAVITCDEKHHPLGLFLNLDGHTLQSQRFQSQIRASVPLKKQLWQQTIEAKIRNQAQPLDLRQKNNKYLLELSGSVKSGDGDNCEAQAATYYWKHLFDHDRAFKRDRFGDIPNHLLNYGYAIIRALTARSLVGSGLLPTLGIFHRSQYNAYCLADDIMEPYRPYVDKVVIEIMEERGGDIEMDKEIKQRLLSIPAMDVLIHKEKSPMMVAMRRTTASLSQCFEGKVKKIVYPQL